MKHIQLLSHQLFFRQLMLGTVLVFTLFFTDGLRASHLLGGDITWVCNGDGTYTFQLRVYRDCSGPALSTTSQSLRVWNHPTITQIPLTLFSVTDISPICTEVAGGDEQLDCDSSNLNAVHEVIFKSDTVSITGIPPAQGWAFTWDAFSRPVCDNLQNASNYGLTLHSIMYSNGMNGSPCYDSSPQFEARPVYTVCTGPFNYVQTASDPDLDSLVFSFANPLTWISTGSYNPPTYPGTVPYSAGFSSGNPTPGTSFNASNVPASLNPVNGNLSFTSYTTGRYIVVLRVDSYRNNILISSVYREILLAILNCGTNTPPEVTPPFNAGTSWSATYYAGDLITFDIVSSDPELLQNGAPQSNILTASGQQFGAGFTDNTNGCTNAPCATLNAPAPVTGSQGVMASFTWQTDCSHITPGNNQQIYTFEFSVQDDYCSVPGFTNKTVTITLLSQLPVPAPELRCANVQANGDVTLTWVAPADPSGSFQHYEIYNGGTLLAIIPTLATTSFTHVGADAHLGSQNYHLLTKSGCNGSHSASSDTLKTMFLSVSDPSNGTAILTWNPLTTPNHAGSGSYYHIYSRIAPGPWTMIDSIPYGSNYYVDTISVCSDSISYMISLPNDAGCSSASSVDGETFSDVIAPYVPEIISASVDTASGLATISWTPNPASDTEGYIILENQGGFWVIIDTVYGINNTTYTNIFSNAGSVSENYSVAAFDSCWSGTPLTPNTSAAGPGHQTIYAQTTLDICDKSVTVAWNEYLNWSSGVYTYEIYASENNGPYILLGNTSQLSYTATNLNRLSEYTFLVKAISLADHSVYSLSNKAIRIIEEPTQPLYNYLQAASVENEMVEIRTFTDLASNLQYLKIIRADEATGPYTEIGTVVPSVNPVTYIDETASTGSQSYYYQVIAVDSCGDDADQSNISRTIYLSVATDQLRLINTLSWNNYEGWDGNIVEYRIFRTVNGVPEAVPVAVVPSTQKYFEDHVEDLLEATGEFCYYIEAIESSNSYGISETVHSNIACATVTPLLWVPNAFTVNGQNPVFKPVTGFIDFNNYNLRVFNRWGEIVFETSDIETGWDGYSGNKLCTEGVYVWQIQFSDGSGADYERRGFVTLLKSSTE